MSKEKIKRKINVIRQIISVLQKWLVLVSSNAVIVIIHHTATDRDRTTFASVNSNHRMLGYSKSTLGFHTAYNTLIDGASDVWLARSYKKTGHATMACKSFHIDVCLTGDFTIEQPSEGQLRALEGELKTIQNIYGDYKLKIHKDYTNTLCPGDYMIKYINDRT